MIKIVEGKFKQAEQDGYARRFNAPGEGGCDLGYWKEKEPNGKFQTFNVNGECLESGIKEGNTLTKAFEINSYQTRLIKTAKDTVGNVDTSIKNGGDQTLMMKKGKQAASYLPENKK